MQKYTEAKPYAVEEIKAKKDSMFKGLVKLAKTTGSEISSRRTLFARSEEVLKNLAAEWAEGQKFTIQITNLRPSK